MLFHPLYPFIRGSLAPELFFLQSEVLVDESSAGQLSAGVDVADVVYLRLHRWRLSDAMARLGGFAHGCFLALCGGPSDVCHAVVGTAHLRLSTWRVFQRGELSRSVCPAHRFHTAYLVALLDGRVPHRQSRSECAV